MKITELKIANFLTIGNAELELDDRGLLLIQGDNEDDTSASSNGAGKSSLVDAICWSIYGTTARGVTGDAVINRVAKKNCSVVVRMEDGGDKYSIHRFRKDSLEKNQVLVYQTDAAGVSVDLSKGTDKETQEVINRIMGCSLEVFMAAVYAGQERMPDLPGMTDKMLKVLIEEAAGVEILTEAYSVARSRLIGSKALLDTQNGLHSAALERQVRLDMELLDQKRQSQEFEDGRRDRAKAELSKAIPLGAEVSELKTKIIGLNEPMVKKELEEIQAQMASFNADQAHYDGLAKLATDLERDTGRLKTEFNMIAGHLKTAEAALSDIDSQVGKPCGECGKVYCEHDLEAAKKVRLDGIAEYKRVLKSKATAFKVVQESVETAIRVAATYKATLPDVSSVAARQSALTIVVSGIVGMRSDIELAEKEIKQLKINANTRLTEANPWTKAIEVKAEEAVNNAADIVRLAGSVASLEGQTNLLSDAAKVFGPAGVRAHILDTVTPYLNERTQEYLGALSDGNIHATWATLSKTAKGELREKFNIEVTNDKGAESFAGMSGGEKRKVRLATAMALQDMVASRASKPINIFIADEVDHALDEFGLERLMGILERKARDRGSVLVISHNSLSDWIDNVITVKKNGGLASVSGATSHGF